jgi:hypothetical protein
LQVGCRPAHTVVVQRLLKHSHVCKRVCVRLHLICIPMMMCELVHVAFCVACRTVMS